VSGTGVDDLLRTVADRLRALTQIVDLVVPYDRGDVLAALHRDGEVLIEVHDEHGTRVRARLPASANGRFSEFAAVDH
jgi:GTP-binding protein HflX